MVANNSAELLSYINNGVSIALKKTMNRLLIELGNIIDKNVYSYMLTGEWDNRTGEFGDSWDFSEVEIETLTTKMSYLSSTISNEDFELTYNNNIGEWSHGNGWSDLTIQELDWIIEQRNGGSNFGFPALKRPYWSEFLTFVDVNLDIIFQEECSKVLPITLSGTFSTFFA